jgi:tetratricopeptide (TPR) repeat protein
MNSSSRLAAAVIAVALTGCATQPVVAPSPSAEPSALPAARSEAPVAGVPATSAEAAPPAPAPAGEPVKSPSATAPAATDDGPLPQVELSPQILFQLLAADLAMQRGEAGAAWSTYHAVARQTRDPRLAARATEIALSNRALSEATRSAQLWIELAPNSVNAAQTLQTLLVAGGKWAELEPVYAQRLAQARTDGTLNDTYAGLQRALLRSADRTGAWQMLQRLSEPDLSVAQARLVRAAVASAANDTAAALVESREAMRLAPDNEDAVVSTARLLAQSQDMPQAISLLETYLSRQPTSLEGRSLYARLLLASGQSGPARAQFERALTDHPTNPSLLLALAQVSLQDKQPGAARTYLQRLLDLPKLAPRERNQGLMLMAQVAADAGQADEAQQWLAQVPRGEDYVLATARRALLLGKSGQLDAARELLRNTEVGSTRERLQLVSAEAQLLREAGRTQEAFELLDRNVQTYPDQPDLLYDHGMAAERLDRMPEMERSMRRIIEMRPDSAHAYNALGYSLADRNQRLDEARTLIEKALSLLPDDAHILDSMGWVLFRQKDLEGALKYLNRAWSLSQEADIGAHLGEVLWVSGRQDEARRLWREVNKRDPANTTLRETLTRLNVAL